MLKHSIAPELYPWPLRTPRARFPYLEFSLEYARFPSLRTRFLACWLSRQSPQTDLPKLRKRVSLYLAIVITNI